MTVSGAFACVCFVMAFHLCAGYKSISHCFHSSRSLFRHFNGVTSSAELPRHVEGQTPAVARLRESIDAVYNDIAKVQEQIEKERKHLKDAEEKYGPEIQRLKEEFAELRARTFAESESASQKAVCDALKEVLPVTDNFLRLKNLYNPLQTDNEQKIFSEYSSICDEFTKIIEGFGVTPVQSLGKPFDYNFMEAILSTESMEYPPDHVCVEYQIGYKMGDRCVRPSIVVVSSGPGPQSAAE